MTHVRDSDIVSARNWALFTSDGAYKPRIMLDYGYRVGVEVVPRKGALDGGTFHGHVMFSRLRYNAFDAVGTRWLVIEVHGRKKSTLIS